MLSLRPPAAAARSPPRLCLVPASLVEIALEIVLEIVLERVLESAVLVELLRPRLFYPLNRSRSLTGTRPPVNPAIRSACAFAGVFLATA